MKLKEYIDSNNLSYKAVGEAIGMHRSVVWNMANGKSRLSAECAKRLAKAYGGTPWEWYEEQARKDVEEGKKK